MAQRTASGGEALWLAFLIGALVVATALFGYLFFSGQTEDAMRSAELRMLRPPLLERPEIPDLPIDVPGERGR